MSPARKGPISQRDLVRTLVPLIDAAMRPQSTAHRDLAQGELRRILATANWRTPFLLRNLNPRRCRWLAANGYWVDSKYLWRPYTKNDEKAEIEE